jgi:hypothetical protein
MTAYKSNRNPNKDELIFWKLSLALANKNYYNVYLICDKFYLKLLGKLPFKKIFPILRIREDQDHIWSIGKLLAYDFIAHQNEPFLHIDSDVFLWEKLPEDLTSKGIFVQNKEHFSYPNSQDKNLKFYPAYRVDYLSDLNSDQIPKEWKAFIELPRSQTFAYNVGIIGGYDLEFFKEYVRYSIDIINNKNYYSFWKVNKNKLNNYDFAECDFNTILAVIYEQFTLGVYAHINKKTIHTLLKGTDDYEGAKNYKYTHLLGLKGNPEIVDNINRRLSLNPYDLSINRDLFLV